MGDPIITGEEGRDLINWFNPATYVCLSQTRTWISNVIWHGLIFLNFLMGLRIRVMEFNATFNNMSVTVYRGGYFFIFFFNNNNILFKRLLQPAS